MEMGVGWSCHDLSRRQVKKKFKKNQKIKKKKEERKNYKKGIKPNDLLLLLYKINNKQRDAKNTIYKKQPKIKKKVLVFL